MSVDDYDDAAQIQAYVTRNRQLLMTDFENRAFSLAHVVATR